MIRVNLLRHPFPHDATCIYFPIFIKKGRSHIWIEVTWGAMARYSAKKVQRVISFKEN